MLWSEDIEWLGGCKNNRLQETHFQAKDKKTESQGMKKCIPCKYKSKKSWGSKINFKTLIRQNKL